MKKKIAILMSALLCFSVLVSCSKDEHITPESISVNPTIQQGDGTGSGFAYGGEDNEQEEVIVEVAVDGNLVEGMLPLRPAIIPQLAAPAARDVEMHLVAVEVGIGPIHRF